jgi:hypothetical protein
VIILTSLLLHSEDQHDVTGEPVTQTPVPPVVQRTVTSETVSQTAVPVTARNMAIVNEARPAQLATRRPVSQGKVIRVTDPDPRPQQSDDPLAEAIARCEREYQDRLAQSTAFLKEKYERKDRERQEAMQANPAAKPGSKANPSKGNAHKKKAPSPEPRKRKASKASSPEPPKRKVPPPPPAKQKSLYVPEVDTSRHRAKTLNAVADVWTKMAKSAKVPFEDDIAHRAWMDYRNEDSKVRRLRIRLRELTQEFTKTMREIDDHVQGVKEAKTQYDVSRLKIFVKNYKGKPAPRRPTAFREESESEEELGSEPSESAGESSDASEEN